MSNHMRLQVATSKICHNFFVGVSSTLLLSSFPYKIIPSGSQWKMVLKDSMQRCINKRQKSINYSTLSSQFRGRCQWLVWNEGVKNTHKRKGACTIRSGPNVMVQINKPRRACEKVSLYHIFVLYDKLSIIPSLQGRQDQSFKA